MAKINGFDYTSPALDDVQTERCRQILIEGWTPEHDDLNHSPGQLCSSGAAYALNAAGSMQQNRPTRTPRPHIGWQFDNEYWKPKNARRDLVRAAALIIAEIERIDRTQARRLGLHRG
ncbi:MAG: hypothetical protein WC322_04875 [Candidatus Paceibacterota bacterium]|jgi:hypothetical protein